MDRNHPLSPLTPLVAIALVGCQPGVAEPPTPAERPDASGIELARFSDCSDLRSYVTDAWVETIVQARYDHGYGLEEDAGADDGGSGGDGSPSDWSDTNVQEEGVDEPDMVKTDGDYIYIAQQGELTIVDAWPAEDARKVASLELEVDPFTMFLQDDRVVLFSYDWENAPFDTEYGYNYGTKVHVIDVSDRTDPQVVRQMTFEGYYTNARMVDSDVYVVMNKWTPMPEDVWELAWSDRVMLPEVSWRDSEFRRAAARTE
ncbi:MAG: beta-propeller domain-containing protein, partial [Myxococcota bacterium]|nr:beta-propeller domain-containing protein [Myxococcota bacterium]